MRHVHVALYIDRDDWWIGYYRGPNHHYVCLLPTVVIRWNRTTVQCGWCGEHVDPDIHLCASAGSAPSGGEGSG